MTSSATSWAWTRPRRWSLLEAKILRRDASLDSPDAAATRVRPDGAATDTGLPVAHPKLALPLALTTFVGREDDMSELAAVLESARLLTLIGPGGVGKTRLAMRLAEVSVGRYPDGVWLCDLATIREPALAADAITTALDVQRRQGRSALESLVEVLQGRHLLVVFDNCEHLLAPIGEVTETVLRMCPGVRILATSREPLAVDGEQVRLVRPLPVPDATETDPIRSMRSASVGLFVDRAISAQPGFRLTPAAVPSVVEICRRLDGVPLAIELAAARVRTMALADVAAGLDERFTLLTAGRRTEPRHQTLLAAVEWSHDLLDPTEQAVFRRLAVFAGTFTLDDVERICTDVSISAADARTVLPALVDKSMVVADTATSPTRYSLLETLRAFGRQHLAREHVERQPGATSCRALRRAGHRGRRRARRSRRGAMDRSPRRRVRRPPRGPSLGDRAGRRRRRAAARRRSARVRIPPHALRAVHVGRDHPRRARRRGTSAGPVGAGDRRLRTVRPW